MHASVQRHSVSSWCQLSVISNTTNITKSLHELYSVVANASPQRHRVLSSHELATMPASIREVQREAKRKREQKRDGTQTRQRETFG